MLGGNGQAMNGYNNGIGNAATHDNKEEGKYKEKFFLSIKTEKRLITRILHYKSDFLEQFLALSFSLEGISFNDA